MTRGERGLRAGISTAAAIAGLAFAVLVWCAILLATTLGGA